MKLQFIKNIPSKSTVLIELPFGVSKVKLRGGASLTINNVGDISNAGINQCTSLCFPILNGKSPNTFAVYNNGESATNVYIFVEELGGVGDPDYFTGGATSE